MDKKRHFGIKYLMSDNKGSVGLIILMCLLAVIAASLIFMVVSSLLEERDDKKYSGVHTASSAATDTDAYHAAGASVPAYGDDDDNGFELITPGLDLYPEDDKDYTGYVKNTEATVTEEITTEELTTEEAHSETDTEAVQAEVYYPTKYEIVDNSGVDKGYYKDPGRIAHSTDYPYVTVDDSYFEDAVFIGDSRTQGLMLYGNMKTATFYCKQSLFVHNFLTEAYASTPSGTMTVPEALRLYKFKKVYIMIGINSMGLSTQGDFRDYYADIVDTVRALQPNAIIFVNGIMNVTTSYSNGAPTINNINIRDKNVLISEFANGRDIFYLDMNEALCGDDGGLVPAYTWDGVHLYPDYYQIWKEFLYSHGLQQTTIDYLNS